jgi:hypothetical protein
MTGNAWHGQMAACNGIIRLLMQQDREGRWRKPRNGVTFFTPSRAFAGDELARMVVAVTIPAFIELQLLECSVHRVLRACLVALVAGDQVMLAFQYEPGFVVIEIGPVHACPSRRIMTSLAVLAQFVIVGIGMTIKASLELKTSEFHIILVAFELVIDDGSVTFFTWDTQMLSCEGKLCVSMAEFPNRFPGGKGVAFLAVRQLSSVLVIMACQAILFQAEKSVVKIFFH